MLLCSLCSAWLHLSWQLGSDGLFKSNVCCVSVEQNICVSGFDIDVTALFGDDIEQGCPAIAVGLSYNIEIASSLVAHAIAVYCNPCLRSIEANQVLCHFMPEIQVHGRYLIASGLNCCLV